ncbi:hypothetical protein HDZ31DRAFT_84562 [Schizophyllum fasciatum]
MGHVCHVAFLLVLLTRLASARSTNFTERLHNIRHTDFFLKSFFGPRGYLCWIGVTDSYGAITIGECKKTCREGSEAFLWSTFSQQFVTWLLPWLAVVSQLPFGAHQRMYNLMPVVLAIGSPALADYSLVLTQFYPIRYPNARLAVRALSRLQQSPLLVDTRGALLASLVALHHNDEWWSKLVHWLEYTHTWSVSAVTNIVWVVIAYVFTVVNAFVEIRQGINASGSANGSLWLWLLPIVIGWPQISPKCDGDRLSKAMQHANGKACLATDDNGIAKAKVTTPRRAIDLYKDGNEALFCDMHASAPIYNHSRAFSWARVAETVALTFQAASERHAMGITVVRDGREFQRDPRDAQRLLTLQNREGTRSDIEAYCYVGRPAPQWVPGIWTRVVLASVAGLVLQWATTGSAVVIVWTTPTRAPSSSASPPSLREAHRPLCAKLALALRRTSKLLAAMNACFVLVACVFHFSNFSNRCYCNSSVLAHGAAAYNVIELTDDAVADLRSTWAGGIVLATVVAAAFAFVVNIYIGFTGLAHGAYLCVD